MYVVDMVAAVNWFCHMVLQEQKFVFVGCYHVVMKYE